ncbi:MAG TPA: DoxX family membrane protein [Candidatus Paceibacterota bacterium]|nr:DoxX family membrane protein [Candidatus Paceibacterota bacterium]
MLTTFPSLLAFSFFAPAFLRAVVAACFAYQAITHFKNKRGVADEISDLAKGLSHEAAVWLAGLLIIAELAVGILLFVGAWTQIAAILAILGFLKMAYFNDRLPTYAPLPRSTYFVLVAICLSLLVTGAGAFAFDLPL